MVPLQSHHLVYELPSVSGAFSFCSVLCSTKVGLALGSKTKAQLPTILFTFNSATWCWARCGHWTDALPEALVPICPGDLGPVASSTLEAPVVGLVLGFKSEGLNLILPPREDSDFFLL